MFLVVRNEETESVIVVKGADGGANGKLLFKRHGLKEHQNRSSVENVPPLGRDVFNLEQEEMQKSHKVLCVSNSTIIQSAKTTPYSPSKSSFHRGRLLSGRQTRGWGGHRRRGCRHW